MKATRLQAYGDADQFKVEQVPDPVPGAGQVLVRVAASSLNPVEVYIRKGYLAARIAMPLPAILGTDMSGTVSAVGPGVTNFKPGDRVAAMLPLNGAGSNAEFTVAAADALSRVPPGVDLISAAAIPVAALTAWQAVNANLKPKKGDRVLVTGALGAVGRAAVFALRQLGAVPVAGVRAGREAEARQLGLETLVIGDAVPADKFDGAIDTIGGTVAASLFGFVKDGGTVVGVAGLPDDQKDGPVKAISVLGANNVTELEMLLAAVGRGDLVLPIAQRLPFASVGQGHRILEAGNVGGKILFTA